VIIPKYFNEHKFLIEKYLENIFHNNDKDVEILFEACRYSLLSGGKRLRGIISMSVGGLLKDSSLFLPLASALEMIHAYSLIHDDLPAMDNDDYRRGKLSNHKVFGDDMAILAGDFLVTKSYQVLCEELSKNGFEYKNILKMLVFLSNTLGEAGMVGGQVMDIKTTLDNCLFERLQKIHELKTGSFIKASFVCPVILVTGETSFSDEFSLTNYAEKLGLLFQIIDDILDETSEQETLGKSIGSDKEKEKATYATILGIDKAKELANTLYAEIINLLNFCDINQKKIFKDFADFFFYRNK
jgi:geranylgeranyl diphosphate synthase, type II